MATLTLRLRIRAQLRKWPWLYGILRYVRKVAQRIAEESSRNLGIGFRFGAAKGFFSGASLLRAGSIEGNLIFGGQSLPVLPEKSIIRDCGLNQNGRQPWPVFWARFPHCRLVGVSLAVMNSEKQLLIESVHGEEFCCLSPSFHYIVLDRPTMLSGPWTSVIGDIHAGFYHWLTDSLPRLALLGHFPSDTRILVKGNLERYHRETLSMLGLLDRVRETPETHFLVEEFFFSAPTAMTGCSNPYAVGWLRSQFLEHASPDTTPTKFFITRKSKTRGICNLAEVVEFFLSSGWAVLDLEELSFAEQIACFQNAEMIVGEHGAAFTNLLWCRTGCRVLELFPENYLNGCYEAIAICLGLDYRYRVFKADSGHVFHVPIDFLKTAINAAK